MLRIRRFGIMRTATTAAVFSAVFVLIAAIIFGLFVLVLGSAVDLPNMPGGGAGVAASGFVGVLIGGVIAAILYAIVGFISAAIGCAVYNIVAGWTGGIELLIDQVAAPPQVPDWSTRPPAAQPPAAPPPQP